MPEIARIEDLDDTRRLELLIGSVTDYAIYLLSTDGRVLSWNVGAERLKGYRAEENIGRHFSDFYVSEDREQGLPQRALEIAARTGRFEIEGWRVRKDGTRFWALSLARSLAGLARITFHYQSQNFPAGRIAVQTSAPSNPPAPLRAMSQ